MLLKQKWRQRIDLDAIPSLYLIRSYMEQDIKKQLEHLKCMYQLFFCKN